MSNNDFIPRILIIDDLFGRTHDDCPNDDRVSLCGKYLFEDVTGDEVGKGTTQKIMQPLAQVVFCRGQTPKSSTIGDTVENDLEGTLKVVREGWLKWLPGMPRWSMVLLDLCFYTGEVTRESDLKQKGMPEGRDDDAVPDRYFGLQLLKAIHNEFPDLPVIVLSSKPKKDVEENYNSMGALGFLARDAREGTDLLTGYIERHGLIADQTGEIIGHSIPLLLALRSARAVAKTDGTVLLRGATGTGKGLFAEYIHKNSHRKDKPLEKISLTAIPDETAESQLFGHVKGSFTDAVRNHIGYFEKANKGTLLLDEIGDASPAIQSKLLRAIEDKEIQTIGAKQITRVDVRVISATKIDIEMRAMTAGGFRNDLYFRIKSAGVIFLPDLSDRIEDIPVLAERFLRQTEEERQSKIERKIAPEAMKALCSYAWQGNVRDLKTAIEYAVTHCPDNEILYPHHFQIQIPEEPPETQPIATEPVPGAQTLESRVVAPSNIDTIDDLIQILISFDFERLNTRELVKRYPNIEAAYAILVANYWKAAYEQEEQSSIKDVNFTNFVRNFLGPEWENIKTTQAKRLIDKFSKISDAEEVQAYWETDTILKTLLERAGAKKNSSSPKKTNPRISGLMPVNRQYKAANSP